MNHKPAHTPTPWITGQTVGLRKKIMTKDHEIIAKVESKDELTLRENAAHIVKCVNAWDDFDALVLRLKELAPHSKLSINLDNAIDGHVEQLTQAKVTK